MAGQLSLDDLVWDSASCVAGVVWGVHRYAFTSLEPPEQEIKVDKPAQRTNAYQRNDNLMLSRDARADSIPGLEIEADDVRCTHGSTSGRVDAQQLFYAQTRGYTRREAVRMIVTGFFQQVFDRSRRICDQKLVHG